MKIEKINENQLRFTLTREDLSSRQIKLSELAYGSEKAKSLFRDMMQQAAEDFGFEANNTPLMVEAIPVSSDSIVLIVTKVDDPDELDSRFARFTTESSSTGKGNNSAPAKISAADDILDLISKLEKARKSIGELKDEKKATEQVEKEIADRKAADQNASGHNAAGQNASGHNASGHNASTSGNSGDINLFGNASSSGAANDAKSAAKADGTANAGDATKGNNVATAEASSLRLNRFYLFHDLQTVIRAAKMVSDQYSDHNSLFKNPEDGNYYLILRMENTDPKIFNSVCNILSEYSEQVDFSNGMEQFFAEHMQVIRLGQAIQDLKKL